MFSVLRYTPLLFAFLFRAACFGEAQHIKVTDLNSIMAGNPMPIETKISQSLPIQEPAQMAISDQNIDVPVGSVMSRSEGQKGSLSGIQVETEQEEGHGNVDRNEGHIADAGSSLPAPQHVVIHSSASAKQHESPLDAAQKDMRSSPQVEQEEEKLRNATMKLVFWLRNRLRKRLEEVAGLEHDMETEKVVLDNLHGDIVSTSAARNNEIVLKLKNEKTLTKFRRKIEQPEKQLLLVQSQTKKLSDKLARLGEVYNSLAEKHRKIRGKLEAAGFSHWLEARGKEYMPETAVGVLSKSVELFEPLTEGFEKAVELDQTIAHGVEEMVPLPRNTLFGVVLEDMVMLVPIIPLFVMICKFLQSMHQLSVLHVVMYLATGFCAEFGLLLFSYVCLGREPLLAMQRSHEGLLIAGIFINLVLYIAYMFTQGLITVLRTSRFETLQSLLGLAIGYHCYRTVFKPAMINEQVNPSGMSYIMYLINFCFVVYEKKRVLNIETPYEEEMNDLLILVESWFWETVEAMNNVFYDKGEEMETFSEATSVCMSEGEYNEADETDGLRHMGAKEVSKQGGIPQMRARAPSKQKKWMENAGGTVLRGRRNYERWSGARVMTSSREFRSHLLGVLSNTGGYRPAMNGVTKTETGTSNDVGEEEQMMSLNVSKSECSTSYGSCKE